MNIRRRLTTAAMIICCLLLAGCSALSLNDTDILVPPRAEGHHARIQALLEKSSNGSYTLIYPSSGEYKSAVIFHDADGDGVDEAVAMYRDSENAARALFIKNTDDGYTAVGDEPVGSAPAERVDFADLDGDGTEEFIISYPVSDSPLCSLSVMRISNSIERADMPSCCHRFITADFDGDGISDILTLTAQSTVSAASASLLSYSANGLSVRSSCGMDESLTSFARAAFGRLSENISGAVIDGHSSSGEYTTQAIYFDKDAKSLINPLLINSSFQLTRRSTALLSGDVDRDGIIEIPVCSLCEHSEKEDASTVCRMVSWTGYNEKDLSLTPKKAAVLCEELGFMFNISDSRARSVTARYDGDNAAALYIWEYSSGELRCTDRLLTIKYYPKEDYDSSRIIEAVLAENSAGVYTYTIDSDGFMSYTDDEVAESFALTGSLQGPSE